MKLQIRPWTFLLIGAVAVGMGGVVAAQDTAAPPAPASSTPPAKAPAKSTAVIDAGEPRANTSPVAAGPAPVAAPSTNSGQSKATTAPPKGRTATPGAPAAKTPGGVDRLNLDTATVTGDREQPKVMYIVPWKKSDIGDLSGKPMNSLLDEALAPVDRDEFKREVVYYNAVKADTSQNGETNAPAKQGEK